MKGNRGFVAIATVLVIAAVVVVVGISNSLTSITEGQLSLADKKRQEAVGFVDGCVEDELLYLNENNAIDASVVQPAGTCTVTTDSNVGNTWTFTVTGTQNGYTKKIQVTATRSSTIIINSWKEI